MEDRRTTAGGKGAKKRQQRSSQEQADQHDTCIEPFDNRKPSRFKQRTPHQRFPNQTKDDGSADAAGAKNEQRENHAEEKVRQHLQDVHLIERIQEAAEKNGCPRPETPAQAAEDETAKRQFLAQRRQEDEDEQSQRWTAWREYSLIRRRQPA